MRERQVSSEGSARTCPHLHHSTFECAVWDVEAVCCPARNDAANSSSTERSSRPCTVRSCALSTPAGYALLTCDPENSQRGWSFARSGGARYEDGSLSRFAGAVALAAESGRSRKETCAGCIVSLTTPTKSSLNSSRSVSVPHFGRERFQRFGGVVLPAVEAPIYDDWHIYSSIPAKPGLPMLQEITR
jgi:hypothetical protein